MMDRLDTENNVIPNKEGAMPLLKIGSIINMASFNQVISVSIQQLGCTNSPPTLHPS